MKYIIYEYVPPYLMQLSTYKRYEIKTDKELKDFLFKNRDKLSNLEIFNKSNKCKINFEVIIEE